MKLKFTHLTRVLCTFLLLLISIFLIPPFNHFRTSALQADEDSSLLFYASFDKNVVADAAFGDDTPLVSQSARIVREGRKDRAVYIDNDGMISYDAPGNVYAERGTISFWWKLDEPLGATPFSILRVSFAQQVSWDYAFVHLFWSGESLEYQVRDQDGRLLPITTSNKTVLVAGRWFYFAMTWDELDGIALYVDGQLIGTIRGELHLTTALDQIAIHARHASPEKTVGNERRVWIDEFRIYSKALNLTQIQNLIQLGSGRAGNMPMSANLNPALWNEHWRARFGWQNPGDLPVIDSPTVLRKLWLGEGRDLGKLTGRASDGKSETSWPLKEFAAAEAGKQLEFSLDRTPWNLLQVEGSLRGQIFQMDQGQKSVMVQLAEERPRCFQKFFNASLNPSGLSVQREDGILREISLYSVQRGISIESMSGKSPVRSGENKVAFRLLPADQASKLTGVSRSQAANLFGIRTRLVRRYLPGDRNAWVGVPPEVFRQPHLLSGGRRPISLLSCDLAPLSLVIPPFMRCACSWLLPPK
ncbi:MAG: LamG-like jellyroll fold domain-containing protein [Terriglobia bacterium]